MRSLSRKSWRVGQRVTKVGFQIWGTIVEIIDKNTFHRLRQYKGPRRWSIHVKWDGCERIEIVNAAYLWREGEDPGFGRRILKDTKK